MPHRPARSRLRSAVSCLSAFRKDILFMCKAKKLLSWRCRQAERGHPADQESSVMAPGKIDEIPSSRCLLSSFIFSCAMRTYIARRLQCFLLSGLTSLQDLLSRKSLREGCRASRPCREWLCLVSTRLRCLRKAPRVLSRRRRASLPCMRRGCVCHASEK